MFLSLILAILSRFFIFHFNKLRSDFVLRIEEWGMSFFKLGERMMDKMEEQTKRDPSQINDILVLDGPLQDEADEFMKLISSELLDTIYKGLAKQYKKANAKGRLEEMVAKEKRSQIDFWAMRKGWGRWGIWCFYCSNVLFISSLIAWFVYVLRGVLSART